MTYRFRAKLTSARAVYVAFQAAVALAELEADKDSEGRTLVREEHIRATIQMSRAFKDYLTLLYKKDEGDRAVMRGLRYDAFNE